MVITISNPLRIVYTGLVYKKQALGMFLDALDGFGHEVEAHFYGSDLDIEMPYVIFDHARVSHEESWQVQIRADVLLILNWQGDDGSIPSKLFEYFAARRPILAVGGAPTCEVTRLIEDTNAGVSAYSVQEVREKILEFLMEKR